MDNKTKDCSNAAAKYEEKMNAWIHRFQNLPEGESISVRNENRASVLNSEIAQIDETLRWVETAMLELDSEHEHYLCDREGACYRYRDNRSIENTDMMFGPSDPCLEDWMAVLRNDLIDSRNELSVDLSKTEKGNIGEENVFRELYLHFPTLSNIVLDVADEGGATNETDFYAILPHGVAVIEVKNYGKYGQQIWVKDAPQWEITTMQGQHLSDKTNPFLQNLRHVKATKKVLNGLLDKEIPLFSVVVLGNNKVRIMNETDFVVTNPQGLCSALADFTSDVTLSEQEQGTIKRHLQALDIGSRSFQCQSYRKRNEHIYQLAREIFPALCDNKVIRTHYYTERKRKNDRLAVALIGVLLLCLIIFRSISDIIAGLTCVCMIISAIALLSQKLKRFFPGLGIPKRDKLIKEICQDKYKNSASKESNGREVRLGEFNRYLLTEAERYPMNFDVTISLDSLPERYIPFQTLKKELAEVREQSVAYIKEHFDFEGADISDLPEIYEITGKELTLGFQMIRHMCNQSVGAFVGLQEAGQYYEKFFKRGRIIITCLIANVLQHESGPKDAFDALPILEELGVLTPHWCRDREGAVLIRYQDELKQAQQFLTILAECRSYAHYLLDLGCLYYEHCGIVVDDSGELFEVTNWNQTFDNFRKLLAYHRDPCEITSADFLNAII